jgi:hypothetical protein
MNIIRLRRSAFRPRSYSRDVRGFWHFAWNYRFKSYRWKLRVKIHFWNFEMSSHIADSIKEVPSLSNETPEQ